MADFFKVFADFVAIATPYVIVWRIGMLIVSSLIGAVTGKGLDF